MESTTAATPTTPARRPPASVTTGNQRITVAFPFSTISISQPDPALQALADLVQRLAMHTAVLARELDTDEADAVEALVDEVAAVVARLEAG